MCVSARKFDPLSRNDRPPSRLHALIAAQFTLVAATLALPVLLFSPEINVTNAALRAALHDRFMAFCGLLARKAGVGQEEALLRGDVAAADVALLLTSLVQGSAIRWVLGARGFDLRDEVLLLFDVQLRLLAADRE